MRPLRCAANQLLLRRADVLAGVWHGVNEDLAATFPSLRSKLVVVPGPLTRYATLTTMAGEPEGLSWPDDGIPLVSVGHDHARKDHHTLVHAVAHAHRMVGPWGRTGPGR